MYNHVGRHHVPMRRPLIGLILCLATAACAHGSGVAVLPGHASEGDWVHFYTRQRDWGQLDYFYDRSRVRRRRDRVIARWKVIGTPVATTTLYVIDISCRANTFTERGTVVIDAAGRTRKVPASERLLDHGIETGTSADIFRQSFCPQRRSPTAS